VFCAHEKEGRSGVGFIRENKRETRNHPNQNKETGFVFLISILLACTGPDPKKKKKILI